MKEREGKTLAQKAVTIFDRLRNRTLPDGNALCYPGEKDGHGQETPLIEGNIGTLFEEVKNGKT